MGSSRPRMTPTATVSNPRMDSRTIATRSSLRSVRKKLPERSPKTKRLTWMLLSKIPLPGWMPIQLPKRKNTKKSKRLLRELPCPFCNKWQAVPVACPWVACPVVQCPTWEEVLLQEALTMDTMIQLEDPPLKKLIKRLPLSVVGNYM